MKTCSIRIIVGIWLCLLAAAIPGSTQSARPDAYAEAASVFQRGDLSQAHQILNSAIAAQPNRPDLLGLMALVLDAQKEYDKAEPFHRRALALAPHSAALWNNFGNHCLSLSQEKKAKKAFTEVLAMEPAHVNANLQLARISLSGKQPAEALHFLNNLRPSDQNDISVQLLRARCLHAAGQQGPAIAIVNRLQEKSPEDVRVAFSVGVVLAEWEQYEEAEAAFSRALTSDPTNLEILHNVGLAALHARHLDRAERVFEVALQQNANDVDSIFNLGRVYAAKGESENALVYLARARRMVPGRSDLLLYLAEMYQQTGFFSGASDAYEEYLRLKPDDHAARRERGFTYCRVGKMKTGLPDLEWYAKTYARDPIGHFELGLCESLADTGQALQQLDEALRLKPDFTTARQVRGWMLNQEGRWKDAVDDLRFVVEREPKNSMALLQLGRTYLELGKPVEAVQFLRRAQELAPDNRGVLTQLHRALLKSGQSQEAAAVLAKLKSLATDTADAKATAHIFDYLEHDPAEQRERFRRNLTSAAAANPSDPELKAQMGAMLLNDGKVQEGLRTFKEVLALSPPKQVLNEGATSLLDHEQYGLAREFLIPLIAIEPGVENRLELALATFHAVGGEASLQEIEKIPVEVRNGDVYLLKAQVLDELGRFEEAADSLNAGFRMESKRSDLYQWAALFLMKQNKDQQALQLLNQATKFVPDNPDVLMTKAVVLELLQDTKQADSLLDRIQRLWPEWGRSYLIRGIIQATHRKTEEALQSMRTAIALGETTPIAYYYLADLTRIVRPGDKEAIQQAISEALRLDAGDALSHALAGKIALDREEPTKAVDQLQEAIRINPSLAEAHYSLVTAYKKLGLTDQAKAEFDAFQRVHDQNPTSEIDTTEIRQMLFAADKPR